MTQNGGAPTVELASQIVISERFINEQLDERIAASMQSMLVHTFASRCLVDAGRAIDTDVDWFHDHPMRSWEVNVAVQEDLSDPSLRQLLVRADIQNKSLVGSLMQVNDLPWWRFLWLKFKGRSIVERRSAE